MFLNKIHTDHFVKSTLTSMILTPSLEHREKVNSKKMCTYHTTDWKRKIILTTICFDMS